MSDLEADDIRKTVLHSRECIEHASWPTDKDVISIGWLGESGSCSLYSPARREICRPGRPGGDCVVKVVFGPERGEVTGGWKNCTMIINCGICNDIHISYRPRRVIWVIKKVQQGNMVRHVARMGEMINIDKILVENVEWKRLLGR
jgi:hypothetical protein